MMDIIDEIARQTETASSPQVASSADSERPPRHEGRRIRPVALGGDPVLDATKHFTVVAERPVHQERDTALMLSNWVHGGK